MPSPQIDPRGQQFAAAVTSLVLVAVLLTAPGPLGIALLAAQAALFATAVAWGVPRTPVAAVFRAAVRPRLAPPDQLEDAEPPRFAQGVGLVFALVALTGFLSGVTTLGYVATGFALVAALLNATIGLCLGCEVYLLGRRALAAPHSPQIPATPTRSTP
jgi:FtsH-binding integral membrane protein